jgi:hypothetical protein
MGNVYFNLYHFVIWEVLQNKFLETGTKLIGPLI